MEERASQLNNRLETTVNIAVLLVAILLGTVLVRNYLLPHQAKSPETLSVGEKLALPSTASLGNTRTIVLALSTTCHFCSESVPFYKRLLEAAGPKNVPVIVAFPQPANEVEQYLQLNNLKGAHYESGIRLRISGTPVIFFLNNKSIVTDTWGGKLPPEIENEVLSKL